MKKNKPTQSGVILLVTGISIMLLGVAADSLHIGRFSFGQTQLSVSVVIVGGIVTLSGLRKLIFPGQAKLDGVLMAAYFLGLLFMGIEPKSFNVSTNKYFLHVGAVFLNKDFLINVLGFLPFGYLVMSYLLRIINYRLCHQSYGQTSAHDLLRGKGHFRLQGGLCRDAETL